MNRDTLKGKWKQIKGRVKQQWGNLTDDDLRQIDGQREVLIGKMQERYGWARDQAEAEYDKFMRSENRRSARSAQPRRPRPGA